MGKLYDDCSPYLEALMSYLETFMALATEYGMDRDRATHHAQLAFSAIERLRDHIEEWDRDL